MSDRTYNGWANYETWAVGMYLDGNYTGEGTYHEVREVVAGAIAAGRETSAVEDGTWTPEEGAKFTVADRLKTWMECELGEPWESGITGDLLGAALSEVDWQELADAQLSALAE